MSVKVTQHFLEQKIAEITQWIAENPDHRLVKMKKDNIVYYAQKLQEMDEKQLEKIEIKIWKL